MVLRREFDVVFWSSDRFIIRITMENNQVRTYNNPPGSLCSILNCPVFQRHRSLSINELKIIMIEKPALKTENSVINKSIHCFRKVLQSTHIYLPMYMYTFWKGPPPPNFFI